MYKTLFGLSFIINIILVVFVLIINKNRNTPEEKELIKNFRKIKDSSTSNALLKDSKEIENTSVKIMEEISEEWTPEVLINKFSPDILKKVGDQKVKQIAQMYKVLGKYRKHNTLTISGYPMRPNSVAVAMQCDFENGNGTVRLVLTKQNNDWMIEGINIYSEAFLPAMIKE